MAASEFGRFAFLVLALLALAHILGLVFARLRQPRVIGEIGAGVLLGPSVLGRLHGEASSAFAPAQSTETLLAFLYQLGLMLLMFSSGAAEVNGLFARNERREVAWLGVLGTVVPFVIAVIAVPHLPLGGLMGSANQRMSLILVIGIAVAVTSIPVITRIFHDLGIIHTRFARLVLGVAVLEDIALWGVLAVATALARSAELPGGSIAFHVAFTVGCFVLGIFVLPRLLSKLSGAHWNAFARREPLAYLFSVLFAYAATASMLDVSLVFAAFLAGFAVAADSKRLGEAVAALGKVSFAIFIPLYFAIVGYRIDLSRSLSLGMLLVFLCTASVIKSIATGIGARLAGFAWLPSFNLSMALNARGGPGIVLASVALDAKIISSSFYTTLVLTALVTSQIAGAWLAFVMQRGWPLLAAERVAETREQPEISAS